MKKLVLLGCVLLASTSLAQDSVRTRGNSPDVFLPGVVITHRTITALDGQIQPLAGDSSWDTNPTGAKTARFLTAVVVRGTTALADDPVLTFQPYVRSGGSTGSVGGATSVTYTRPRLENLSSVKVQKTVDDGVSYTDYSANVIDDSAGTVADFSSLDTLANGDWIIVGATTSPIMGAAWDMTTLNATAATFTLQYWDGAAWQALANGTDGTLAAGATFGADGQMTWDMPTDWESSSLNSVTAYWARISVSAALDATTTAEELDLLFPIQASIDVDVQGDDVLLYLESLSSVTGTIAYSGSVALSWR